MNLDTKVLEDIAAVGSRNSKLALLEKLEDGKELLAIALDPGVTFGVTADEDHLQAFLSEEIARRGDARRQLGAASWWDYVYSVLENLRDREFTGNLAEAKIADLAFLAPSSQHCVYLARLINKDLRCGIQLSSLLKVWPGLVEPFAVQLALQYDPAKHKLEGEWYLEPKLDGLRMVVIDGVAYSRSGRVITSVDHITSALKSLGLSNDFVFDGEVMGGGAFDEASGKVRRKSVDAVDAVYHIFDVVRAEEWASKKTRSCRDRKNDLAEMFIDVCDAVSGGRLPSCIKLVTPDALTSPTNAQLIEYRDRFIAAGYEGVMLKDANAPYQFKRGKHLLKFKDFASEDCEIIDMVEGKGKYKGMLGAIVVKMPSGVTCEVGTGFNDAERKNLWNKKNDMLGAVIEVQHQEPLSENGRMRFPSFMRFRPDKE